jgi:hypothetical protein
MSIKRILFILTMLLSINESISMDESKNISKKERQHYPKVLEIAVIPPATIKQQITKIKDKIESHDYTKGNYIHKFIWQDIPVEIEIYNNHDHHYYMKSDLSVEFIRIKNNVIQHFYRDEKGVSTPVVLTVEIPDYEKCSFLDGKTEWQISENSSAKPPLIKCHLLETSAHKQSLADISFEHIIEYFREGKITLDELEYLPSEMKEKLPQSIKYQLENKTKQQS